MSFPYETNKSSSELKTVSERNFQQNMSEISTTKKRGSNLRGFLGGREGKALTYRGHPYMFIYIKTEFG